MEDFSKFMMQERLKNACCLSSVDINSSRVSSDSKLEAGAASL